MPEVDSIRRLATQLEPESAEKYRRFLQSGRLMNAARAQGWLGDSAATPARTSPTKA